MIDRGWFRYAMAVVLAVGAVAASAGMILITKDGGPKTVTVTETVKAPPLTAENVAADVTLRLGPPAQQIPGVQVSPNLAGSVCDVWGLADAVVLSCHP